MLVQDYGTKFLSLELRKAPSTLFQVGPKNFLLKKAFN